MLLFLRPSRLHAGETNGDYIKEALAGGKGGADVPEISDEDDDDDSASVGAVDDEGAMALAVEATRKFLLDNPDATPAAVAELVTNQQMASALKSQEKVHILVRAALTPNFFKEKEIPKYSKSFAAVTNGNRIMERHLISALEHMCVDKPKNFPVALKQMYDEDALDEEAILEWADEGRSEYTLEAVDEETRAILRGQAEPVVVWLQEADSEDDSSSGEE